MSIPLANLIELVAMFAKVVVLTYISISVYLKNPSERVNQLFSLATFFAMLGFLSSGIGTLLGVTAEISILSTRYRF
ncbi:MAG: hypothetical protein ACFFCZ_04850 [Promethearchaeota archaeon]